MKNCDTELSFESEGEIKIYERKGDRSPFDSVLLAESNKNIDFRIGLFPSDEREDGTDELYRIYISKHHIDGEDASRAFHAHLSVTLTREDLIIVQSYIEFLIGTDMK